MANTLRGRIEEGNEFGELTMRRTPSSFDDDLLSGNGNTNAIGGLDDFSTIELNGSSSNANIAAASTATATSTNGFDTSYTSFGQTLSDANNNEVLTRTFKTNGHTADANESSATGWSMASSPSAASILTTASEASSRIASKTASTFDAMRQWSKSAYKCTRQIVAEKLGKAPRTVDPELEANIDDLRDLKRKYEHVLGLARSLTAHFLGVVETQKALGDSFAELAQRSPELNDEFASSSSAQRSLTKHGETLINGIKTFTNNLQTLCSKTIEDTLLTVRNYEAARLEYDANRSELELLEMAPPGPRKQQQMRQLNLDLDAFRARYESLRQDVSIKIQLLNENRIKVMRNQLDQFQTAIVAYFAGSRHALEDSLNQFAAATAASALTVDNTEPLVAALADGQQANTTTAPAAAAAAAAETTFKFESFLEH